ncbi:MAG TPA: PPC domain-containing protein [Kofleriaceae bacterium]|nr:PPC domain-containing protein [Kofleriaceae bacterium]
MVASCPYPAAPSISFDKELMVRLREVVEDPCRTTWNQSCTPDIRGRWTFGYLMAAMSGATVPAGSAPDALLATSTAQLFVGNWLKYWLSDQTVGADPNLVLKRNNIRTQLLNRWFQDSGCTVTTTTDPTVCHLNLQAAPFRLLAVVNRIDMAGFDYATGGNTSGELRFVFAAYDRGTATVQSPITTIEAGNPRQAEVILEYRYPTNQTAQQWATRFHNLSNLSLSDVRPMLPPPSGATAFGVALQAITEDVVKPGAQSGAPNGSAIGQIRSLESAFDSVGGPSAPWEFRQVQLSPTCTSGACQLLEVQLPQTPPTTANPSNATAVNPPTALTPTEQAVSNYIVANQADISTSHQILPAAMLAGSLVFRPSDLANLWAAPSPVTTGSDDWNALIRHNFAFATCNGCHYFETANEGGAFHVKPRLTGATSDLSNFLKSPMTSSDNGVNPDDGAYLLVSDPQGSSTDGYQAYFQYNEPWRRSCEIRRILTGDPNAFTTATGHGFEGGTLAPPTRTLQQLSFEQTVGPSSTTHLTPSVLHGYDFDARAGAAVSITMTSSGGCGLDTYLYLYGPKNANGSYGLIVGQADDSGVGGCGTNSQINFTLPTAGNYLIVATSYAQAGTGDYQLQLHCAAGAGNCQ